MTIFENPKKDFALIERVLKNLGSEFAAKEVNFFYRLIVIGYVSLLCWAVVVLRYIWSLNYIHRSSTYIHMYSYEKIQLRVACINTAIEQPLILFSLAVFPV